MSMIQRRASIRYFIPCFLLALILVESCSPSRKVLVAPIREEGADYLITKLKENELKFDWFSARFSAEYENNGKKN